MNAKLPIEFTDGGIIICLSDSQFSNALSSIEVIEERIDISDNDEHLLNEKLPISVTEEGIVICFNELQS